MIRDEAEARAWVCQLPDCDTAALARLDMLVMLLAEENSSQNLVSATSFAEVWRRHVADSAQLLRHVPRETSPWMDLGTGAGFPGLVVAALRPDIEVILVESRKRRIGWLERAADALGLTKVSVEGNRLEDLRTRSVAAISARAFAPLDRLLALAARFSTSDTIWLLPKGKSAPHELAMLQGWDHRFHVEPSLTDPEAGVITGTLPSNKGNPA